jgi:hypothetical protein
LQLHLGGQPLVLLADDRVDIVDMSTGDDWDMGNASLARVNDIAAPTGLAAWRIVGLPPPMRNMSLLTLDLMFHADRPEDTGISMAVTSYCDLWRPETLEWNPNEPHGPANARMLLERFEALANASGATINDDVFRVSDLKR